MATIRSVNPATLEVNGEAPVATAKDVEAAVAAARAAQPAWAATSLDERARLLRAFSRELLRERTDVARLVAREMGKPVPEALAADVIPVLDAARWLTTKGRSILKGRSFRLANPLFLDRKSTVLYEPRGVVGVISPWNYPFGIPGVQALYALFAGNAVVLKPASATYLTALRIKDLLGRAGLPEDLLRVVVGSGSVTGQALIGSDLDYLVFTGSVPVGKAVEPDARARGIPTCMELGGSDPALVLDDANLDLAANGVAWGRFTNAGQTCAAVKRCFVHEAVHDRFLDLLADKVGRLRVGNPLEPGADVGALVDGNAVEEMEAFVRDAVERGARVVTGGKRPEGLEGHFFEPTLLADVPADARVLREEVFGPILPVVSIRDEDDGVARANDSPFGLTASVWTRDRSRGERLARRLDAGTVTLNDHMYTFAANETPWGGRKDSGHGFTHGPWGLLEMTRMKHVNAAPASRPLHTLWWYPYGDDHLDTFEKGASFLYGSAQEKLRVGGSLGRRMLRKRNL